MKKIKIYVINIILLEIMFSSLVKGQSSVFNENEFYRPLIHFSPKKNWMNDPNGMVFYKGIYHLFYQHNPYGSMWGPMHWGHATSKDLIHWKHEPIAIYPDSLGTIFSGSAVVDINNTSGFGINGKAPLVAIFTQHNTEGAKAGRKDFQTQGLAYSNDNGKSWTKYNNNPVIKNPGIIDFRDPKVMWYEPRKKWVMSLATKDRITFYSSINLKDWEKESEFGENIGAHGGVWECPDLFMLDENGKKVWVLFVSINPGGPNKGSATQYFLGDFDGSKFTPYSTDVKWVDYGPDNYAGVTWSNTGERKIFIGWLSNWQYANIVPTTTWRNAATIARDVTIKRLGNDLFLASEPISELSEISSKSKVLFNVNVNQELDVTNELNKALLPFRLNISLDELKDFSVVLSNDQNDQVVIGFDKKSNQYFIDRSKSGIVDFHKEFAGRFIAPRISDKNSMNLSLLFDVSSVELFADDGLSVLTSIIFPKKPLNHLKLKSAENINFKRIEYLKLKSIN